MVNIFKTNVQSQQEADYIVDQLLKEYPKTQINFDLYDCDKILRVEGIKLEKISSGLVEQVRELGYFCDELF